MVLGGRWSGKARACARVFLFVGAVAAATGCGYNARERASGWLVAQTQHIRVQTDLGAKRATELAVALQRIRDVMTASVLRCAFEDESDRVVVTVLPAWEFREIVSRTTAGQYRRTRVSWISDYHAGQILIPDELGRETMRVFQHELTHHLVSACFPSAPAWLDEGLATLLGTMEVEREGVLIGVPQFALLESARPHIRRRHGLRVQVLPLEGLPSVAQVTSSSAEPFFGKREHDKLQMARYYAVAWALVHLLELDTGDLKPRFSRYLGALREVEADAAALFAGAFRGVDLQRELDDHVRRARMGRVRMRARAPRPIAARVRAMTEGEAHLHRAWLWGGAPAREARDRLTVHLEAARGARQSDVRTRARLLTAVARYSEGDPHSALREVTQALRAAPKDPELLHAELELLLEIGRDPSATRRRLSAVAHTAAQLCALADVALRRGEIDAALGLALRGLEARRNSPTCRAQLQAARKSMRTRAAMRARHALRSRDAMRAASRETPAPCVGRCSSGPASR
jgi:hypothetical protein